MFAYSPIFIRSILPSPAPWQRKSQTSWYYSSPIWLRGSRNRLCDHHIEQARQPENSNQLHYFEYGLTCLRNHLDVTNSIILQDTYNLDLMVAMDAEFECSCIVRTWLVCALINHAYMYMYRSRRDKIPDLKRLESLVTSKAKRA